MFALSSQAATDSFPALWDEIVPIGRSHDGGYQRLLGSTADHRLREWFTDAAERRGMRVETDGVGNQWAWLGDPDAAVARGVRCLVLGSHLDSVSSGGGFDGALGVVAAFCAVDSIREASDAADVPIGVVSFMEEEGSRFGLTCLGSRVLAGEVHPEAALALRDDDGISLAEAIQDAGRSIDTFGSDKRILERVGTYVELHIEQGRGLVHLDRPVAVGSAIRPYGRWKVVIDGEGNHAGTTQMTDRNDPMSHLAELIQRVESAAVERECVATIGKIAVWPNVSNAIPSQVVAWLDARGADAAHVMSIPNDIMNLTGFSVIEESFVNRQKFDSSLARYASQVLGDAPILESGAGHDAGVLASAGLSSAMLFVRNPSGISHSRQEYIEFQDCITGVEALSRLADNILSSVIHPVDKTRDDI